MHSCHANPRVIRRISLMIGFLFLFAGCAVTPPAKEESRAEAVPAIVTIEDIAGKSMPSSAELEIKASGELDYTSVKQLKPLGVIFYFPNARLGYPEKDYQPEDDAIKAIRLSSSEDKKNVRMEIELDRDMSYTVNKKASGLNVIFYKKNEITEQADAYAGKSKPGDVKPEPVSEPGPKKPVLSKPEVKDYHKAANVEDIHFASGESGTSVITIGTSRPVDYDLIRSKDRLLKLRLFQANLPEHSDRRPLITTRFDSAVDRVIPYQIPDKKDAVELLIELRQAVPYRVERQDRKLLIHFEPSTVGPRPYPLANLPEWQNVLEEAVADQAVAETAQAGLKDDAAQKAQQADWLFEKEEYTGEKIALDFYETDIKNVFRILQQISGKNYAIDPDVQGKVTITMERPVPWDQVLDLILKQNRLGKVERDDIIRIATLNTLREEEEARQQRIEAYKKRLEQEKAMEPLITEYMPISYASAQNEVLPHIQDILSERGKVNVDARNNQLILTDTQERIEKAQEVIAEIDKVTPQVIIEARIVEINEDFLRDIGTEFSMGSEDVYRSDLGGNYSYDVAMNHPGGATSGIGFNFSRLSSMGTPFVLDAKLNAMEEENNVKIISAPKIVTLDNKKATIKQGFEIPYQTVEDDDVEIEFKEVDLRLEVTPHVTPDERISLQIYVTKNEIAELTMEAPALSTNEAITELLVDDGDTIVIGGIKKDTTTTKQSGFPILKDIPILGWLFKRDVSQTEKSELLIFMTPRIVQLEQRQLTATTKN